ncbi:hypothetical protein BJX62DRAFT_202498 [Aspergillus germanicus]
MRPLTFLSRGNETVLFNLTSNRHSRRCCPFSATKFTPVGKLSSGTRNLGSWAVHGISDSLDHGRCRILLTTTSFLVLLLTMQDTISHI